MRRSDTKAGSRTEESCFRSTATLRKKSNGRSTYSSRMALKIFLRLVKPVPTILAPAGPRRGTSYRRGTRVAPVDSTLPDGSITTEGRATIITLIRKLTEQQRAAVSLESPIEYGYYAKLAAGQSTGHR